MKQEDMQKLVELTYAFIRDMRAHWPGEDLLDARSMACSIMTYAIQYRTEVGFKEEQVHPHK